MPVKVRLSDERDGSFEGKLDFAENRVDRETGTVRVRAVLPNPDLVLQPGLFGTINIPGSLPYRGVLIPANAIPADQTRPHGRASVRDRVGRTGRSRGSQETKKKKTK